MADAQEVPMTKHGLRQIERPRLGDILLVEAVADAPPLEPWREPKNDQPRRYYATRLAYDIVTVGSMIIFSCSLPTFNVSHGLLQGILRALWIHEWVKEHDVPWDVKYGPILIDGGPISFADTPMHGSHGFSWEGLH